MLPSRRRRALEAAKSRPEVGGVLGGTEAEEDGVGGGVDGAGAG